MALHHDASWVASCQLLRPRYLSMCQSSLQLLPPTLSVASLVINATCLPPCIPTALPAPFAEPTAPPPAVMALGPASQALPDPDAPIPSLLSAPLLFNGEMLETLVGALAVRTDYVDDLPTTGNREML